MKGAGRINFDAQCACLDEHNMETNECRIKFEGVCTYNKTEIRTIRIFHKNSMNAMIKKIYNWKIKYKIKLDLL